MDDKIAGVATYNIIDWKRGHYKFQEGDIVYIYCSMQHVELFHYERIAPKTVEKRFLPSRR